MGLSSNLLSKIRYCKRCYFRWGKISRKCWQDFSRGGNFHDSTHISLIKSYGFYFRVGEIFANKAISRKSQKITHTRKFPTFTVDDLHMCCLINLVFNHMEETFQYKTLDWFGLVLLTLIPSFLLQPNHYISVNSLSIHFNLSGYNHNN